MIKTMLISLPKLTYTEVFILCTEQYNSQNLTWSLKIRLNWSYLFLGFRVWRDYQIVFCFSSILLCPTPINSSSLPSSSWWPWLRRSDSFSVMLGTCKRRCCITHRNIYLMSALIVYLSFFMATIVNLHSAILHKFVFNLYLTFDDT